MYLFRPRALAPLPSWYRSAVFLTAAIVLSSCAVAPSKSDQALKGPAEKEDATRPSGPLDVRSDALKDISDGEADDAGKAAEPATLAPPDELRERTEEKARHPKGEGADVQKAPALTDHQEMEQDLDSKSVDEPADAGSAEELAAPASEPVRAESGMSVSASREPGWARKRAMRRANEARRTIVQQLAPIGGTLAGSGASTLAAAGLSCGKTCEVAEAICMSSDVICDVARRYDDRSLQSDCEWAERECKAARNQCSSCGGGAR